MAVHLLVLKTRCVVCYSLMALSPALANSINYVQCVYDIIEHIFSGEVQV
jgi:hypothetical protein